MRQSRRRRTHRRSARSTTGLELSSLVGDAPGLQEREGGNGSALPRNPVRPGVLGPPGRAAIRFDSASETWSTKSALYNPLIPRWNTAGTAAILRTISRFQVLLLKLAFGRKSYLLLTIHSEKTTAVAISNGDAIRKARTALAASVYWYKFMWQGKPIRESTRQGNNKVVRQMEAAHRTSLAKGEVGPTGFCLGRSESSGTKRSGRT
jgi:hypothetical protein